MSKILDQSENRELLKGLESFGLSEKEAAVYLALLPYRDIGSSKLVAATGLHKQFVYNALARLEEMGLAKHVIVRGRKNGKAFEHDDGGSSYLEHHHYQHGRGKDYMTYTAIADRERGAQVRLQKIMQRYPKLHAYVQTDPRGCALYVIRPGDVPPGSKVCECCNRGIAVFK